MFQVHIYRYLEDEKTYWGIDETPTMEQLEKLLLAK